MINKIFNYEFSFFNINLSGRKIVTHPFFAGSAVMILGSNLTNFIAYIYHVVIGRLLGPAQYSILASILSYLGLVTTAFSFLGLVIVKFVSAAEEGEKSEIFAWFNRKITKFAIILTLVFVLISRLIANFLHINSWIVFIASLMVFASIFAFFYRAFLQGILRFKEIVLSTNFDMLGRLALGILAIYLGFSVSGVVAGIVLSSFATYILLRYYLKDYINIKDKKGYNQGKKVLSYTLPVFLTSMAMQSFFSTDLLLVKHFFIENDAGIYASLSTLGKIIFYGTAPVSSVMFPMISQRFSKGQNYKSILFLSMLLTGTISGIVIIIYYLFPKLMVTILYGKEFLEASPYLFWFGLYMGLFSLASLISNFYLSKEVFWVSYLLVLMAFIQGAGIWLFHDTIFKVVTVSIVSASLLLIILLSFFAYESARKKD